MNDEPSPEPGLSIQLPENRTPGSDRTSLEARVVGAAGLGMLISGLAGLYGMLLIEWEAGPDVYDTRSGLLGWPALWLFHGGALIAGLFPPFRRTLRVRLWCSVCILALVIGVDVLLFTPANTLVDGWFRGIIPVWHALLRHLHSA